MALFASGVTVVTTRDERGVSYGFTASSFCSASVDPPLVLVCLAREANSFPVFARCSAFAVSILQDHHAVVAERFASKRQDKFSCGPFDSTENGLPTVEGALCVVECELADQHAAGDHVILVGRVHGIQIREGTPLIYFNRSFRHIAAP
jgi:flavin reductase ActVB